MKDEREILYEKWINKTLSNEELEELKASGELSILEKIMNETGSWTLPKPKKNYSDFKEMLEDKKSKVIPLNRHIRIAASILLFIAASYFSYVRFFNTVTYNTIVNQTKEVTLPDGTQVILNSNSELHFNKYNWSSNRKVELKGQAYFDIEKKGDFEVKFTNGNVKVLGTEFDVLAYNNQVVVNCFEGKVATVIGDKTYELTQGMGVRNVDGEMESYDFLGHEPTWNLEFSTFKNTPLSEVLNALSLRYDLEFITNGVENNKRFTGQFSNKDLSFALKMVLEPLGIQYQLEENKVTLVAE